MKLKSLKVLGLIVVSFAAGALATRLMTPAQVSADANRVYELRMYHTAPGKFGDVVKRFKDDTRPVFDKHGIKSVGYWLPEDEPNKDKTFIYIVSHPSREAATKDWKEFREDPEWTKIVARTEANGKLVEKIDSIYMDPTDFSKLK